VNNMKIILIVLGIIILLAAIICLLPVKVIAECKGKTRLKVFVYGIRVYDTDNKKDSKPKENKDKKDKDSENKTDYLVLLKENIEFIKEILIQIVEKIKKYVIIKNVEVKYRFGLGDAAVTGIFSGAVYAVINGFAAYIRNYCKVEDQKLEVIPDFDNKVQEFEAKIEIVIRAVFFVPVFLRILKIFKGKEEV